MTTSTPIGTRLFVPTDPAVIDDPYPHYARLRAEEPVAYLADHDLWLVTRYADVVRVLRDPAVFSSRVGMNPDFDGRARQGTGIDYRFGTPDVRVLIATDPPEHLTFRRAVAGAFTRSAVAAMAGRVDELARACVRDLLVCSADGEGDLYRQVAEPLPVLVLGELLGVPDGMRAEFREWTMLMSSDLDQATSVVDSVGKGMAMFRFFHSRLRGCPVSATPTLFDSIATARGSGVSDRELLAFCAFLLFAGIETTTSLMTNVFAVLLGFPEVAQRLRRAPELVDAAVEEGLRYDTSVQALWRGTTRPVELAGVALPEGARVMVAFGSANRDERRFVEPDRFRLDRGPAEHLGFGGGPHLCLGARLARLQVAAAVRALLAATSAVEAAGDPVRVRSIVLRGFTRQSVVVCPA